MKQVITRLWQRIPPLGMLALAAFVICAATGIMLVPAYIPSLPLDSLALVLLKNPAGILARSLHYWSAQAFFALSFAAHRRSLACGAARSKVRFGVWLRLSLAIPVVATASCCPGFFYGQILPLSRHCRFCERFSASYPCWEGRCRDFLRLGTDLTTVYLHHACTATIILWLITIEHSRRIMPTMRATGWTLPPLLLLSLLLSSGTRMANGSALKKDHGILSDCRNFFTGCRSPRWPSG